MDSLVSDLEHNLEKGFHADQLVVKHFDTVTVREDDLAILFINMDEEFFEALVNCLCEESEVQLQKGVEEEELKAVIREEVLLFVEHTI